MSHVNIFKPLDASKNEIRLLDILPADDKADGICCNLRTVSLDDDVPFDALSWCWGDAPKTGRVVVNGQGLECSTNLEATLRNFRDSSATKTFWVDATCINQSDIPEKSTQIPLMSRIYGQAEVVRVWLGEAVRGSEDAVKIMKQLREGYWFDDCRLKGSRLTKEMIESFCLLLESPWWKRIWVAQEVALARCAIMYYGAACFELAGLPEALDTMYWDKLVAVSLFKYMEKDVRRQLIQRLYTGLRGTFPVLRMVQRHDEATSTEYDLWREVRSILELSYLKATDLRDKVYGCFGLLPELASIVPVDYGAEIHTVYIATSWALIWHSESLSPLRFVGPRRTFEAGDQTVTVPSWSIDFSQDLLKTAHRFRTFYCGGEWGELTTEIRSSFLAVSAVLFDEVIDRIEMYSGSDGGRSSLETARRKHSRWRAFCGLDLDHSDHSAYVGAGSIESAYWRLIAGDTNSDPRNPHDIHQLQAAQINRFGKWLRTSNTRGLVPVSTEWVTNRNIMDYDYLVYRFARKKYNTYLFKTRKGYMGMSTGVRDVQIGDHIHFLHRGDMPWVLRPVQDDREGAVFEVACECYIHGVMDGEVFRPPPATHSKAWKRHELRRRMFGGQALDTDFPLPPWTRFLLA